MLRNQDTEDSTVFVVGYGCFFVLFSLIFKVVSAAVNLETAPLFFRLVFFCCPVTKAIKPLLPCPKVLEYGLLGLGLKRRCVLLVLDLAWVFLVFKSAFVAFFL